MSFQLHRRRLNLSHHQRQRFPLVGRGQRSLSVCRRSAAAVTSWRRRLGPLAVLLAAAAVAEAQRRDPCVRVAAAVAAAVVGAASAGVAEPARKATRKASGKMLKATILMMTLMVKAARVMMTMKAMLRPWRMSWSPNIQAGRSQRDLEALPNLQAR